jgi:hypothetical protein
LRAFPPTTIHRPEGFCVRVLSTTSVVGIVDSDQLTPEDPIAPLHRTELFTAFPSPGVVAIPTHCTVVHSRGPSVDGPGTAVQFWPPSAVLKTLDEYDSTVGAWSVLSR